MDSLSLLFYHFSSGKFQQTNSSNPLKSVIPSMSGSEMSPIKCQVTSSNQRTTCIYLVTNDKFWQMSISIQQVLTNEHLVF